MKKKQTFWRNLAAFLLKNERWKADPRNAELIIRATQLEHNIDWV